MHGTQQTKANKTAFAAVTNWLNADGQYQLNAKPLALIYLIVAKGLHSTNGFVSHLHS